MIYPTINDRKRLAEEFQLSFDVSMQDWEIEIANPQKLSEFISYFSGNTLSDGQRVSLAQIIFRSIEELLIERKTDLAKEYWNNVFPLLHRHDRILEGVLDYWKDNSFYLSKLLMQANN